MNSRRRGVVTWMLIGLCAQLLLACAQEPAPAYVRVAGEAPRIDGAPTSPAQLVVFWAAWCPPCRTETPQLRALAQNPPEGLQLVLLSHDPDMAAVERFLGGEPEAALHLRLDANKTTAQRFGVEALPDSFLVVEGRLVARFRGPREWDSRAMRRLLTRLIDEARASAARPVR